MKAISDFLRVIDAHTLSVTVLAVIATAVCTRVGFYAELPTALIGIAIIFPIVFSINSAYRRREDALKSFATLKAHAVAIYYAHRDWTPGPVGRESESRALIDELFAALKAFFRSGAETDRAKLETVYRAFSGFSLSHERLRASEVATGEISRVNQYLRSMIIEFEKMRNILIYRTPAGLRAYSKVFLNAFPILYAPYFAQLSSESHVAVGYAVAVIYSVVLVSLDNIQDNLENPYDAIGGDDIELDVLDELRAATAPDKASGSLPAEAG